MKAKISRKAARLVSKAASKARSRRPKPTTPPKESDLGRQIFVYNHLQTNQVVYSLTRTLRNNHALRQLPYNGKKTVPAALRKDLWAPLACINLTPAESPAASSPPPPPRPSPPSPRRPPPPPAPPTPQRLGLLLFQKLREYRKLHETQWPASFALDPKTHRPLTRRERGRRLCDQKANSVADMAAALASLTLRREVREVVVDVDREDAEGKKVVRREVRHREVAEPLVRATVQWRDILDAEFAQAWPKTVVHDRWLTTFNNRKAPVVATELREVGGGGELPVVNEAGKVEL